MELYIYIYSSSFFLSDIQVCPANACSNGGICLPGVSSHRCICDLTGYYGDRCLDCKYNNRGRGDIVKIHKEVYINIQYILVIMNWKKKKFRR